MKKRSEAILLASFVIVSAGSQAAVLYWVTNASLRLSLGLALLVMIYWAAIRLSLAERAIDLVTPAQHPRRFVRLRADVEKLLDQIRRLNWIAVDGSRGVRDLEETQRLMDSMEEWLKKHVTRIRESAGRADEP